MQYKDLVELHAIESECMPDSERVQQIEAAAVEKGYDLEKLRSDSLFLESL